MHGLDHLLTSKRQWISWLTTRKFAVAHIYYANLLILSSALATKGGTNIMPESKSFVSEEVCSRCKDDTFQNHLVHFQMKNADGAVITIKICVFCDKANELK